MKKESGFSLTLLGDVLEHIEDDRATLKEIYERTTPGGYLYITVPIARETLSEHALHVGHVRSGYKFEQIQLLLSEAGFKIIAAPNVRSIGVPLFLSILDKMYRRLTRFRDRPCLDFRTLSKLSSRRKAALAFIWPFYRLAMELDIIAHGVQERSIVVLAQKRNSLGIQA